jgi:hypothetical protein
LRLVTAACDQGGRFTVATPEQLDALRRGFAPAVAALERDPATRASLARIRALVAGAPDDATFAIPPGCSGAPLARLVVGHRHSSAYDGVYRWTFTPADSTHDPFYDPATTTKGTTVVTMWLDRQHWRMHITDTSGAADQNYDGTYRVDGELATFAWGQDGTAVNVFRLTRTPDGLRVKGLSGDPGDRFVWGYKPWHRVQ